MDKVLESVIKKNAKILTKEKSIWGVKRIINIMNKYISNESSFSHYQNPLSLRLYFIPSLEEALDFLPPN